MAHDRRYPGGGFTYEEGIKSLVELKVSTFYDSGRTDDDDQDLADYVKSLSQYEFDKLVDDIAYAILGDDIIANRMEEIIERCIKRKL